MTERMRSCAKTACRWPAASTLSFRYATREVWLSDLEEDHPATYDLCPHHADVLAVPRGWALVDQRTVGEVVREPSADEIAARAASLRSGVERQQVLALVGRRASRYDALVAELPRLAAEAGGPDAPGAPDATAPADGHPAGAGGEDETAPVAEVVLPVGPPSRDLAPVAVDAVEPVGPLPPDVPLPFEDAVVLPLDRARRRPPTDPVNA